MSITAQRVLRDLIALDPADLQQIRDEASRLLARQSQSPPGRQIRPTPPAGYPGGSLERDDPFFEILERLEAERQQRLPRAPIQFEV